jgi:putative peptidoglycan lipid II flippase
LREIELAAVFGVSAQADAAVLLLTLPDLLVNLLLSGGLSAALIPRLRSLTVRDAQILLRQVLLIVVLVFSIFAISFAVMHPAWFSILAPGLQIENMIPTTAIIAMAAAIPLTAASGVTTAGLYSQQMFFVAGCGTLIFNVMVIGALRSVEYGMINPLIILGAGIAVGAVMRLSSQLIVFPRKWLFGPTRASAPDMKFIRAFATAATTASLMLLVPVIVRALISLIRPGAMSALNYATKMVELPAAVLVTSLATVALARLSVYHAKEDTRQAQLAFQDGLRQSVSNAIGAGILIAYFADVFVSLLLGRGAMDGVAVDRVTSLARILIAGLPFLAIASMKIADLNAQEQQAVALKATLASLLLLPALAAPGLLVKSEALLAWSIVGFQVLHALFLMGLSGRLNSGGWTWFDNRLIVSIVIVTGVALTAITLNCFLSTTTSHPTIASILILTLALGAVIVLPQRVLKNSYDAD